MNADIRAKLMALAERPEFKDLQTGKGDHGTCKGACLWEQMRAHPDHPGEECEGRGYVLPESPAEQASVLRLGMARAGNVVTAGYLPLSKRISIDISESMGRRLGYAMVEGLTPEAELLATLEAVEMALTKETP